jgi:ABC-type phosphate/phosphonate transport system substrate-binding protein
VAGSRSLRFLTYLSPGVPRGFFDSAVAAVANRLGIPASLDLETSVSGPSLATDPFRCGRADFAFVCAPAYPLLERAGSAELVAAAPVPTDPRAGGRPVYFADVVVRAADSASGIGDLLGRVWTLNDPASLSGWHSLRARLREVGASEPRDFFREIRTSGSHRRSTRLVAAGEADGAAIDSNALVFQLGEEPELRRTLRVLETWGPLPIQPLLAARSIDAGLRRKVAEALLQASGGPAPAAAFDRFGFAGFAPVDRDFYSDFPILEMARR